MKRSLRALTALMLLFVLILSLSACFADPAVVGIWIIDDGTGAGENRIALLRDGRVAQYADSGGWSLYDEEIKWYQKDGLVYIDNNFSGVLRTTAFTLSDHTLCGDDNTALIKIKDDTSEIAGY